MRRRSLAGFFFSEIFYKFNIISRDSQTLDEAKMRVRTFILPIMRVCTFILRTLIMGKMKEVRTLIMGKMKVSTLIMGNMKVRILILALSIISVSDPDPLQETWIKIRVAKKIVVNSHKIQPKL